MRTLIASLAAALLLAGGAGLAIAARGGHTEENAAHHQYRPKPGCRPLGGALQYERKRGFAERRDRWNCARLRRN